MEALKLGDTEQQYYAELFQSYDVEGSGKITGAKASELFCASGLNSDTLRQITELCGAKRLGHFGRSQFYIALKLVAIAQAGLPVKLDSLNSGKEISLPKFEQQVVSDRKKSSGEPDGMNVESLVPAKGVTNSQMSGQLPPPPKKSHIRSLSGHYRAQGNEAPAPPTLPAAGAVSNNASVAVVSEAPSNVAAGGAVHHNSKSPPLSPTMATSQPSGAASTNQKPFLKQHTAPAGMFAAASSGQSAVTFPNQSSIGDHTDGSSGPRTARSNSTAHDSTGNSHINPVALEEEEEEEEEEGGGQKVAGEAAPSSQHDQQQQQQHHHHHNHHHHSNSKANNPNRHSLENGNWAMFEDEENHMLIGSGVKQHYNTLELPNFDSSSISSEAESVDDIWSINDEQREYYMTQFKTMQPDLTNVITGPVAKHFFEKSKLPVIELSKIWQLSDLNCDGALSMEEFCIAMHLVVLRRNEIELPDRLPLSLMPYSTLANDEPFAADLPPGSTLKRATPPPEQQQQNAAQWTAFVQESPQDESSGVPSSPASLANFEFAKPSADPDLKIVQPVALRMSPEGFSKQSEGLDRGRAFSDSAMPYDYGGDTSLNDGDITPPLAKQRAHTTAADTQGLLVDSSQNDSTNTTPNNNSKYNTPIHGRPRPVPPKKHSSVPAILRGQLPPPVPGTDGIPESGGVGTTEPSHAPPAPPPRPHPTRSMSVDVKSGTQLIAPAVPPRVSPKEAQSAVKPGDSGLSVPSSGPTASIMEGSTAAAPTVDVSELTHNVTGVDKDLIEDEDAVDSAAPDSLQPKPTLCLRQGSRDRREIHMAVRTHKERNAVLTRLNSELNQELQEVMEQRIALEIQLEHLRPFSS